MSLVGIVTFTSIGVGALMILIYLNLFSDRSVKTNKRIKKSGTEIKEKLSASAQKQRNIRMKQISDVLNFLPYGRLTPTKRKDINQKLASVGDGHEETKIAEEIHVQEHMFLGLWVLFCVFLGVILTKYCFFGLILAPLMFSMPIIMLKSSVSDEEEALEVEFRNFYNLYYVQFNRVGSSLKLLDVIQSYKGIAPASMMTFVSKLEVDAATSEIEALKLLDKRYAKSADVHRFCAIATSVSRGDSNAKKVVKTFQDELTTKKVNRQLKELARREKLVEGVIAGMLYGICTAMMVVTFISFVGA